MNLSLQYSNVWIFQVSTDTEPAAATEPQAQTTDVQPLLSDKVYNIIIIYTTQIHKQLYAGSPCGYILYTSQTLKPQYLEHVKIILILISTILLATGCCFHRPWCCLEL